MAKPNPLKNAASEVAESLNKAPDRPQAAQEPARIKPTGSKSSREGKRFIGLYVDPMRHDEIRQAAMDEDIKLQDLMRQAIDEWMKQNGQEAVRTVAARHERRKKRGG